MLAMSVACVNCDHDLPLSLSAAKSVIPLTSFDFLRACFFRSTLMKLITITPVTSRSSGRAICRIRLMLVSESVSRTTVLTVTGASVWCPRRGERAREKGRVGDSVGDRMETRSFEGELVLVKIKGHQLTMKHDCLKSTLHTVNMYACITIFADLAQQPRWRMWRSQKGLHDMQINKYSCQYHSCSHLSMCVWHSFCRDSGICCLEWKLVGSTNWVQS